MDKIETVMYSVDSTGTTLPAVFYNDNILNSNDRPEESKHIYLLHIIKLFVLSYVIKVY